MCDHAVCSVDLIPSALTPPPPLYPPLIFPPPLLSLHSSLPPRLPLLLSSLSPTLFFSLPPLSYLSHLLLCLQLSREAFKLDASIPHMVANNQIIVHVSYQQGIRQVVELHFHARKWKTTSNWCHWHADADELPSASTESIPNSVRWYLKRVPFYDSPQWVCCSL